MIVASMGWKQLEVQEIYYFFKKEWKEGNSLMQLDILSIRREWQNCYKICSLQKGYNSVDICSELQTSFLLGQLLNCDRCYS